MKLRKEKGFTLIELMVVVAIIGILAAVAIPKFADLIDKSKEAKTKGNLSAIRSAVSIYYGAEEGEAPTNIVTGLCTEYMTKIPAGDIPFCDTDGDGDSDASYTWAANAAQNSLTYANAGATTNADGWAYDSSEPEVWVEVVSTTYDTKGAGIYLW